MSWNDVIRVGGAQFAATQMGTMNGGRSAAGWRIILAACCWSLLALIPEVLLALAVRAGLFEAAEEAYRVAKDVADLATYAILLFAAFREGRSIGGGDPWAGIGYAPIARTPIIIAIATLVAVYALLLDTITYHFKPESFGHIFKGAEINAWLGIFSAFMVVILVPTCEELFFRGWLWTGLRKHWGPLATASTTGGMWLILHLAGSFRAPIVLLPLAATLSLARHFAGSVKASIALHVLHNSTLTILPWLFLAPA